MIHDDDFRELVVAPLLNVHRAVVAENLTALAIMLITTLLEPFGIDGGGDAAIAPARDVHLSGPPHQVLWPIRQS